MRASGAGTPPPRRSVVFAGTGWGLVCGDVTQVQGICWTGLVGDLRRWNAGLSEMKVRFLELVDRMGRWPGYGGSSVAYGRMAGLWGSAKTYEEMRQACDRMGKPRYYMGRRPVYGRPLNRMGSRENVWGNSTGIGNSASVWEAARLYGERKSHESQERNNGIWPADFACFHEFGGKR